MKWDTSRWSRERIIEFIIAVACLGCAIAFNSFMGGLADVAGESAHPSPDMLLALLPRVDLRILFVWGFAAYFITYAVYRFENRWFRWPYRRLRRQALGWLAS